MALHPEKRLNGLALCAGAGGLELGLHIAIPEYRTVCFVERDAYAASALVARMDETALPAAPVWSDLGSFDGQPWRGKVDIISAGYPCQPFSAAGKRQGERDPRHLWPEVGRILAETEAPLLFAENVEGHLSLGLEQVRADLLAMGYEVEAGVFTAAEVGASHIRKRLFILAYADRKLVRHLAGAGNIRPGLEIQAKRLPVLAGHNRQELDFSLAAGPGQVAAPLFPPIPDDFTSWERFPRLAPESQPAILRTDDGLANQVDRLRLAGNGVVPLAAAYALRTLAAIAAA